MGGRFVADFTGRLLTGYFSMATLGVAGESHYQEALDVLGGGRTPGGPRNPDQTWFAVPEPDNPKDPAAVRVFLMDNRVAGLLSATSPVKTHGPTGRGSTDLPGVASSSAVRPHSPADGIEGLRIVAPIGCHLTCSAQRHWP
jgi:hypothetical protein